MRAVAVVALLACGACGPGPHRGQADGDGGSALSSGGTGTPASSACAVEALFAARCVACHSPAGDLQGGLDLATDPVAALADQPSATYANRTLVIPGDPEGSFLIAKVSGAQGADGAPMPLPTGLEPDGVLTLRTWVQHGVPWDCDGGTHPTEPAPPYHPAGWVDPGVHGLAAKLQQEDCGPCHGEDLAGGESGVSCDGCHARGWRTTCTYCHGGVDDLTGAPPENIDDTIAPWPTFSAHTAHVEETIHPAYGCAECHAVPNDPLTPGHVLVGDTTPGEAEVAIADATWSAGTCSNVYCHGDGQTSGTVDGSFVTTCDGCHPDRTSPEDSIRAMSGEHHRHISNEGFDCSECHSQTVDASHAIVDPTVHVDGAATVAPIALTWDAASGTCTGTCHDERHDGRHWD